MLLNPTLCCSLLLITTSSTSLLLSTNLYCSLCLPTILYLSMLISLSLNTNINPFAITINPILNPSLYYFIPTCSLYSLKRTPFNLQSLTILVICFIIYILYILCILYCSLLLNTTLYDFLLFYTPLCYS